MPTAIFDILVADNEDVTRRSGALFDVASAGGDRRDGKQVLERHLHEVIDVLRARGGARSKQRDGEERCGQATRPSCGLPAGSAAAFGTRRLDS